MLDSEKIELIAKMLDDFYGCGYDTGEHVLVMLNAIGSVVDFKRKDQKNAD